VARCQRRGVYSATHLRLESSTESPAGYRRVADQVSGRRGPPPSYRAFAIFSFSILACFFTDSSLRVSAVAIVARLMPLPAMNRSFTISAGVQACRCRSNFLAMLLLGVDAGEPDSRIGRPCEPSESSRTLAARRGSRREIAPLGLHASPVPWHGIGSVVIDTTELAEGRGAVDRHGRPGGLPKKNRGVARVSWRSSSW
jgi:hypothetical protein